MSNSIRPNRPDATFEVRFEDKTIQPEAIPPRILYDLLSAIQDLASGRDPYEMAHVPPEKSIALLDVERGSTIYQCIAHAPAEALKNFLRVGALLTATLPQSQSDSDRLAAILSPLKTLSDVAKSVGCGLYVVEAGKIDQPLFNVQKDDYKRLSKSLLMTGETSVVGTVQRVGGATGMRCLLRIPNRRRILYCDVQTRKLVRKLGQHLYENIVAQGTATWLHRTWRIYRFTISDFTQPQIGDASEAISDLRKAGLDAWDKIEDPEAYIREARP